jgi:hypothetical protein
MSFLRYSRVYEAADFELRLARYQLQASLAKIQASPRRYLLQGLPAIDKLSNLKVLWVFSLLFLAGFSLAFHPVCVSPCVSFGLPPSLISQFLNFSLWGWGMQ